MRNEHVGLESPTYVWVRDIAKATMGHGSNAGNRPWHERLACAGESTRTSETLVPRSVTRFRALLNHARKGQRWVPQSLHPPYEKSICRKVPRNVIIEQ